MSNFTEKMRMFCEAKASGAKNVQAALLAGYSAATAKTQGSALVARADIRAEIAKLKRKAKTADADDEASDLDPRKILKAHYDTPLDLMLDAMNQPKLPFGLRFEAAKQAMPFVNARMGEKGKKEKRGDAAHDVTKRGKFAPKDAPPLPSSVRKPN